MIKITNMNRNEAVSYAAQMRDRSRGLDRIMGELKGERAENRRLRKELASYEKLSNKECQTIMDLQDKVAELETANKSLIANNKQRFEENAELVEKLDAKSGSAEKVDGAVPVYSRGDRVALTRGPSGYELGEAGIDWPMSLNKHIGKHGRVMNTPKVNPVSVKIIIDNDTVLRVPIWCISHAAPCQSCAANEREIVRYKDGLIIAKGELEQQVSMTETVEHKHKESQDSARRFSIEMHNKTENLSTTIQSLQSQIDTQGKNSADTQQNLERAREIIGLHEASILRVTAELTAALGGGV